MTYYFWLGPDAEAAKCEIETREQLARELPVIEDDGE